MSASKSGFAFGLNEMDVTTDALRAWGLRAKQMAANTIRPIDTISRLARMRRCYTKIEAVGIVSIPRGRLRRKTHRSPFNLRMT